MKHLIKNLITACLGIVILITTACKKDKHDSIDVAATLQGKTWKLTAETVNPADNGVTDFYSTIQPCDRDNTFTFNAGNVFIIDEDATKCDPSNPQTITGTWSYNSSTKILNTTTAYMGSTSDIGYIVSNINETSFSCFLTYDFGGGTHTITYTYTKQ